MLWSVILARNEKSTAAASINRSSWQLSSWDLLSHVLWDLPNPWPQGSACLRACYPFPFSLQDCSFVFYLSLLLFPFFRKCTESTFPSLYLYFFKEPLCFLGLFSLSPLYSMYLITFPLPEKLDCFSVPYPFSHSSKLLLFTLFSLPFVNFPPFLQCTARGPVCLLSLSSFSCISSFPSHIASYNH